MSLEVMGQGARAAPDERRGEAREADLEDSV